MGYTGDFELSLTDKDIGFATALNRAGPQEYSILHAKEHKVA